MDRKMKEKRLGDEDEKRSTEEINEEMQDELTQEVVSRGRTG